MMAGAQRLLARYRAETRLALRLTIAAVLAYWVGAGFGFAQSYWAVFTAIIVMQANLGGSLKATVERLLGTMGGSAWGLLVCLIEPPRDGIALSLCLVLVVGPLAILAAVRPTFRVAPVTGVIVLMSVFQGRASAAMTAFDRTLEIALGSIIALVVSLVVFPARAHRDLMDIAARALLLMRAEILQLAEILLGQETRAALSPLQQRLRDQVVRADVVTGEAERERASHLWDGPDLRPLTRMLWRLRGDFAVIARASAQPIPEALRAVLETPLRRVADTIAEELKDMADALQRAAPLPPARAKPAIDEILAALAAVRQTSAFATIPSEAVSRLSGLSFGFEQLAVDLADLSARLAELPGPPQK
jgi:uncharacterized membrane protein YccC